MSARGWFEIAAVLGVVAALARPLGLYLAWVFSGQPPQGRARFGVRGMAALERGIYRLLGVSPESADDNMTARQYSTAFLVCHAVGFGFLYLLLRGQAFLPGNSSHFAGLSPDLAMNVATSFVTNTNWQSYAGESTLGNLAQMAGLGVQNFLSAAAGLAVLAAVVRGFANKSLADRLGNFWVDATREVLYILLPLSFVGALGLASQGVVQTFAPSLTVQTLEGGEQTLARGPVASQVAIKQLGTNGGGFFNANSAHPFENPTPLSNVLEVIAILLLPVALCVAFGRWVGDGRQGAALLATMALLFLPWIVVVFHAESQANPTFAALGIDSAASATQEGGNLEGKEQRLGVPASALWASATTAASNGSVNAMHGSMQPRSVFATLWLMLLGEVAFGGVGSGLYGMLLFVVLAVFTAGLMVGRAPEYLGKKIEPYEMKMATFGVLMPSLVALLGTALATAIPSAAAAALNTGPRAFSELLYAFASAANNNGSALAGLSANAPFWNLALSVAMFVGRFVPALAALAIAGSLACKRTAPAGAGTLPTHTPLFVLLLAAVVIVVAALSFLPALALGPIAEETSLSLGVSR